MNQILVKYDGHQWSENNQRSQCNLQYITCVFSQINDDNKVFLLYKNL